MKKYLFLSIFVAFAFMSSYCEGAKGDSILLGGDVREPNLIVNNRILVKVNGKVISVIDLMKKMDMLFYKQYPQFATSIPARYQFYLANWKSTLNEMIDKELILADSENTKLVVNQGDVREEMETLFGPNIIVNLDKIGLTFNEAHKMVLEDIIMRRMLYFRVQSNAIAKVTPQVIRNFYEEYSKNNTRDNQWVYRVVTIRHRDATKAAETANLVHHMLTEDKVAITDLSKKLEETGNTSSKSPTVNISEEFRTNEKELSENYRKTLETLSPGNYSAPIIQKSRSDNSSVVRIFYYDKIIPGGAIPYNELADKIKDKLLDDEINKESEKYFAKLRKQYHVQDDQLKEFLSSDFKPFALEQ